MINIFFVPGMFGSTIEYVLRSYTKELTPVERRRCCADGSMHNFSRQLHTTSMSDILKLLDRSHNVEISTSIYPFQQNHLLDIVNAYKQFANQDDKNILIYAPDLRSAELNMLFQYYKIAFGSNIIAGLDLFCSGNEHNITNWNHLYTHWSQMQPWELREWLSLFYVNWMQEWTDSYHLTDESFLKIKNTDILYHPYLTIEQIAEFCKLTITNDMLLFLSEWQQHQQYIVTEFEYLDQIIDQTIDNWKPLSIISEAIIQQRLRSKGIELCCHGLNTFPTDSNSLYKLLKKC
jgi:hypothetical protein